MTAMECLYFVQVRGEIWIPEWLYEGEELTRAIADVERAFGLPVCCISFLPSSRCRVCLVAVWSGRAVVVADI